MDSPFVKSECRSHCPEKFYSEPGHYHTRIRTWTGTLAHNIRTGQSTAAVGGVQKGRALMSLESPSWNLDSFGCSRKAPGLSQHAFGRELVRKSRWSTEGFRRCRCQGRTVQGQVLFAFPAGFDIALFPNLLWDKTLAPLVNTP